MCIEKATTTATAANPSRRFAHSAPRVQIKFEQNKKKKNCAKLIFRMSETKREQLILYIRFIQSAKHV